MNKCFVLFTPVKKRFWVIEEVTNIDEFDPLQTQP